MSYRAALAWLAALAAVTGLADRSGLFGGGTDAGAAGALGTGLVTRVVDGDTIHVDLGGRDLTVRYIGMDTPETVKPNTPVQCYGKAASNENKHLVTGQRVKLVPDAEPLDKYGRTLAYVYRVSDGLFVNQALLQGGYARTLTIPPNDRFADRFAGIQQRAQAARTGLWGACGG